MVRVFINYRREDSQHAAGRLCLELQRLLGPDNIYFDIKDMKPGDPFPDDYAAFVAKSDVVLVLIGDRWLKDRRLHLLNDHVRSEILIARTKQKSILPVLLDFAVMPPASDLPVELRFLSPLTNEHLVHRYFVHDVGRLYKTIRDLVDRHDGSAPLSPLLLDQRDRALERARESRDSRNSQALPSEWLEATERAHVAELEAITRQFGARGEADAVAEVVRRAMRSEKGTFAEERKTHSGGLVRWYGETPYDQKEGLGELSSPIEGGGTHTYTGRWKNNREFGLGVTLQTDGTGGLRTRVEGEIVSGVRHGYSVKSLPSGHTMAGNFRDNRLQGAGVYRWPSGNIWEGDWHEGEREGFGVEWDANGRLISASRWKADQKVE